MASPVKPIDFKNVVSDPTTSLCGGFTNALLKLPTILYQFINWLLDSNGNVTPAFKQQIIPPGARLDSFVTLTVPDWLLCDGSQVSQTTYPSLFAAIGTTFGPAVGGNFTLPDCRARFPITAGSLPSATVVVTGGKGGEETHVLIPNEIPFIQLELLSTSGSDKRWVAAVATGPSAQGDSVSSAGGATGPRVLTTIFGNNPGPNGVAHNTLPPYFGMYTYIKT